MASIQGADASDLLRATDVIRRRTRAARRSFWFPLTLFGALVVASGSVCGGDDIGGTWENRGFWLIGGIAAYGLIYWFYRRRPVWTEIRPYVGVGAFVLWMSIGFYLPVFQGALVQPLLWSHRLPFELLEVALAALFGVAVVAWLHHARLVAGLVGLAGFVMLNLLGGPIVLLYGPWGAGSIAAAAVIVAVDAARMRRRAIAWTAGLVGASVFIIGVFPTLFGPYYMNYPAAFLFGYDIIPSAAPVAAIAVGLLILAIQVRSPWLAIAAVTTGVLSVLSGLFIIDNFFNALPHCGADMGAIGGFMLVCAGIAAVAERRGLAT